MSDDSLILGRDHNGAPVRQGTPQASAIRREQIQQSLRRRTLPDQTLLVNDLGDWEHVGAMELPLGFEHGTMVPRPPAPAFQGRRFLPRPPAHNQPLAIRRLARGREPLSPQPDVRGRYRLVQPPPPQEIIEGRSLRRETLRALRGGMNTDRCALTLMRRARRGQRAMSDLEPEPEPIPPPAGQPRQPQTPLPQSQTPRSRRYATARPSVPVSHTIRGGGAPPLQRQPPLRPPTGGRGARGARGRARQHQQLRQQGVGQVIGVGTGSNATATSDSDSVEMERPNAPQDVRRPSQYPRTWNRKK